MAPNRAQAGHGLVGRAGWRPLSLENATGSSTRLAFLAADAFDIDSWTLETRADVSRIRRSPRHDGGLGSGSLSSPAASPSHLQALRGDTGPAVSTGHGRAAVDDDLPGDERGFDRLVRSRQQVAIAKLPLTQVQEGRRRVLVEYRGVSAW